MSHCPSGRFFAGATWLVLATLAHNLLRWTCSLGLRIEGPVVAETIRRRFIALPGRLTRSARSSADPVPPHALLRPRPVTMGTAALHHLGCAVNAADGYSSSMPTNPSREPISARGLELNQWIQAHTSVRNAR